MRNFQKRMQCRCDSLKQLFPLLMPFLFFMVPTCNEKKTVIKTLNLLNITVALVTSRDPSNVIVERRYYQKCNVLRHKALDFSNLEP